MKSIVVTYPHFQSLPKGLKQLLVTSENHFFDEARTAPLAHEIEVRGLAPTPHPPRSRRPSPPSLPLWWEN